MRRPADPSGGFSLVEALIAIALTALVSALVVATLLPASRLSREVVVETELTTAAQTGVARLCSDLRNVSAKEGDAQVIAGGRGLRFRVTTGFDGSTNARELSPPVEVLFEHDPGELDNGADDDGDGLVDEGRLLRRETGATRTAVIVDGVAETPAFSVTTSGEKTTVAFTFEVVRAVSEPTTGRVIRSRTATASVRLN